MRAELLQVTRMVAGSIDVQDVEKLTGTEADLESDPYRRVKRQITDIHNASSNARFLYLMQLIDSGEVIFLVDSEPPDSKDYSPPGQVYDEISEYELTVFKNGQSIVSGPYKDRWGVWISGLVPVIDESTGRSVAVFGIDIDAHNWRMDILSECVGPISLALLIFLIFCSFFMIQGREKREKDSLIEAKNTIERSEYKYRSVVENIQDVFCRIDIQGRIELLSPSASSVFGLRNHLDLIGRSVELVCANSEDWLSFFEKLQSTGKVMDWEIVALNERGDNPVMSVSMYRVTDEKNNVVGFEGIWRDISERKKAIQFIKETERRQSEEMALASEVQKRMVTVLPANFDRMELDGVYRLKKNIGGDYYEYLRDPFGIEHLLVADISGHDLSAGLFCSALSLMFKQAAPFADIPDAFIGMLNHEFLKIAEESNKFFTAVYVQINNRIGRARIVNAGNPPVFVLNSQGIKKTIEPSGLPVGLMAGGNWNVEEFDFSAEDILLVFTDGITESKNQRGDFLGTEGMSDIIREITEEYCGKPLPVKFANEILERAEARAYFSDDDVTILTIRPLSSAVEKPVEAMV